MSTVSASVRFHRRNLRSHCSSNTFCDRLAEDLPGQRVRTRVALTRFRLRTSRANCASSPCGELISTGSQDERCGELLDLLLETLLTRQTAIGTQPLSLPTKQQLLSVLFELSPDRASLPAPNPLQLRANPLLRAVTQSHAFSRIFQLSKFRSRGIAPNRRREQVLP